MPEVEGALSVDAIRRLARRHQGHLRRCYERGLQLNPELWGRLLVRFMIAPTGRVQTVEIRENTVGNAVASCFVARIRRWRFPPPEGGGMVVVTYPFVLTRP